MPRAIVALVLLASAAGLRAFAEDEPKPTAEKLVGVWKLAKSSIPLPDSVNVTIEFKKEGKLAVAYEEKGEKKTAEGTWKLDGQKLKITLKRPGKSTDKTDTVEITKLTDQELVTDDKSGKVDEFKRVRMEKK